MTVALSGTRLILGVFTTTSPDTTAFTPAAAPQGIVVGIVHGEVSTDLITGVTYGGVAMTRIDFAQDTSGEPGAAYLYFLGASIPTGTQNVVITHTGTATVKQAWCRSLTAAADTQVAVSGVVEEPQADPDIALDSGAASSLRVSILYSGAGGIGSLTVLTGMEAFDSAGADANVHDFGNHLGVLGEQTTASTGSFTIGYTVVSVAVAMVAAAIQEVTGGTAHTASQTDPEGLTDTAAVVADYVRPNTDPLGLVDSAAGVLGINVTISDLLGLVDDGEWFEVAPDVLGLLDDVTYEHTVAGAHTRTVTDSLGLTDSEAHVAVIDLIITDILGLLDGATTGTTGAGFWTPDPVAFVRIGPGDEPPWN